MERLEWIHIIWLIGVLILVVPGTVMVNRKRGTTVANIAIWLGLAVFVAGLYRLLGPE